MTTCAHPSLHVEEAAHYRCAACGTRFVVLRIEEPEPASPPEPLPTSVVVPSDEIDVSGRIGRFIPEERRPPRTRRR